MTAPVTVDNRRPVTESAERFLRAIIADVPVDRLAELHLFTTLRQGVYESGVAVIAAWPLGTPRSEPVATPIDEPSTDDPSTDTPSADDPSAESAPTDEPASDAPSTDDPATDAPRADDPSSADHAANDQNTPSAADSARHTIYTARYRLVVKGPDRGRWEFECVAEADAPLITAENVVRGVQRRSGDLDAPTRYDASDLRHVLRLDTASAANAPASGAPAA
jgi:hypothetical protein